MSIVARYDFGGHVYGRDTETGELIGPYESVDELIADNPDVLVAVPGGHVDESVPPIVA